MNNFFVNFMKENNVSLDIIKKFQSSTIQKELHNAIQEEYKKYVKTELSESNRTESNRTESNRTESNRTESKQRGKSAYYYFLDEMKQELKGKMKWAEIQKEVGRLWKEQYKTQESRKKWIELSNATEKKKEEKIIKKKVEEVKEKSSEDKKVEKKEEKTVKKKVKENSLEDKKVENTKKEKVEKKEEKTVKKKEESKRPKTAFMFFHKDKINHELSYKEIVKAWKETYNTQESRKKWINLAALSEKAFEAPDIETARKRLKAEEKTILFNFDE